jgi:hypothetical protein
VVGVSVFVSIHDVKCGPISAAAGAGAAAAAAAVAVLDAAW